MNEDPRRRSATANKIALRIATDIQEFSRMYGKEINRLPSSTVTKLQIAVGNLSKVLLK